MEVRLIEGMKGRLGGYINEGLDIEYLELRWYRARYASLEIKDAFIFIGGTLC